VKFGLLFSLLVAILVNAGFAEGQRARDVPKSKTLTAREIAEKVMPSVVLIITQDENGNPISQGSGFVYKPGLVVSNLHVFERASSAIVKNIKTGKVSKAIEVVGMNAKQDICIIRIENITWPAVSIGDSYAVRTGDEIYVASNPKGLEGSLTKGIISGIREQNRISKNEHVLDAFARDIVDLTAFQIDASISPGSSGGALLDVRGAVVGIVKSSVVGGQNLNFAIPAEQLGRITLQFNHPIQLAGACAYSDVKKERLKGQVRSVETRELPGVLNSAAKRCCELIVTSTNTYDLDGMLIESSLHDVTNGRLTVTYNYFYDVNFIKTKVRALSSDTGKISEILFDFENGIFNKLYGRSFSGSIGKIDGAGGMKEFDSAGNVSAYYFQGVKYTYTYDANGRVEMSTQTRDGVTEIVTQYRYTDDKNGNWIRKIQRSRYPNTRSINPETWFPRDEYTEHRTITYYQ